MSNYCSALPQSWRFAAGVRRAAAVPSHLSAVPPAWRRGVRPARLRSRMKSRSRACGYSMPMRACIDVGTSSSSETHILGMNICDCEGQPGSGYACN
jgi:hypothetical protein